MKVSVPWVLTCLLRELTYMRNSVEIDKDVEYYSLFHFIGSIQLNIFLLFDSINKMEIIVLVCCIMLDARCSFLVIGLLKSFVKKLDEKIWYLILIRLFVFRGVFFNSKLSWSWLTLSVLFTIVLRLKGNPNKTTETMFIDILFRMKEKKKSKVLLCFCCQFFNYD